MSFLHIYVKKINTYHNVNEWEINPLECLCNQHFWQNINIKFQWKYIWLHKSQYSLTCGYNLSISGMDTVRMCETNFICTCRATFKLQF